MVKRNQACESMCADAPAHPIRVGMAPGNAPSRVQSGVSTVGAAEKVAGLKRQMQQVEEYISKQHVPCTSELLQAKDVVDEVLSYSKKIHADLIMIMTQGETNWIKFFIGSSAQEIINRSEIPVLSINPSQKKSLIVAEY